MGHSRISNIRKSNTLNVAFCLIIVVFPNFIQAQPDQYFAEAFNFILPSVVNDIYIATPFGEKIEEVHNAFVPSLNLLISNSLTSFPLTSSISVNNYVIQVREDAGIFVSVREPLAPLYGEIPRTIGKGNFDIGINYSRFDYSEFRGINLSNVTYSFVTVDFDGSGVIGNSDFERSILDVSFDMPIDVQVGVFLVTYGLTPSLDLGVVLPFIRLDFSVSAFAQLECLSTRSRFCNFFIDSETRMAVDTLSYSVPATSIEELGDIALRLKYAPAAINQNLSSSLRYAAFLEVRLPTGKTENFLSTGHVNAKLMAIIERTGDRFAPHVNLGYEFRGAPFDSDAIAIAAGVDVKLFDPLDLLVDVLLDLDLSENTRLNSLTEFEPANFAPVESDRITDRGLRRSNLDRKNRDSNALLAVGVKYAPTLWVSAFANLLVPLSNGGLTFSPSPTAGIFVNF